MTQGQDKKTTTVRVQFSLSKKVPTMGYFYFLDFFILLTR